MADNGLVHLAAAGWYIYGRHLTRVTPKDISVALIRVLAIVRNMMELSGSVIAASESAITAAATADKEGDHAP